MNLGTQLTKRPMISLEYATQCFCDDEIRNQGELVNCSNYELMTCKGNISQLCGGASIMNLFRSD